MRELDFMRRCMKRATEGGARLFRNNVARAWVGNAETVRTSRIVQVEPGDVLIRNARPLHAGLAEGSGDLIGWVPVEVTPDMVGRTVALFASVETKSKTGRATKQQRAWAQAVSAAGGLSGIARTDKDLHNILWPASDGAQGVDKTQD